MSKGINIIGGKYRGRKLNVPQSDGLRPTPNRIRETLFNWLQGYMRDINTLDLFAGSGLLSFEAMSRGAKTITLLEKQRNVVQSLKRNALFFPDESIKIHQCDAFQFIKTQKQLNYQLIFIDPPFAHQLHQKIFQLLSNKLAPNTLLYIESPIAIAELPFNSKCIKSKQAGQVFYSLHEV